MVPALVAPCTPRMSPHLTVGCSTGFMHEQRGDWPGLVRRAAAQAPFAVELAALSEPELPGLVRYLESGPSLPFLFTSVHAPSKHRRIPELDLVGMLSRLPRWIDAIVVHPDSIGEPDLYRALGRRLVIENMDARKIAGQTAAELAGFFEELPDAGLCFDVAHAKSVDATMAEGGRILDEFGDRLRHVHLSSLDQNCHHVPLTEGDESLFESLLSRCRDVPWILEAPTSS
jgi:xylose isomerase-like TIM barrel protein